MITAPSYDSAINFDFTLYGRNTSISIANIPHAVRPVEKRTSCRSPRQAVSEGTRGFQFPEPHVAKNFYIRSLANHFGYPYGLSYSSGFGFMGFRRAPQSDSFS